MFSSFRAVQVVTLIDGKMFCFAQLFLFSWLIIFSDSSVFMHNPFYCYSQDPIRPQLGMLGHKSAYETNRGHNIDPTVSKCKASKFWLLSRHGTRLPSTSQLTSIFANSGRLQTDILANYNKGRTSLCATDVDLIKNWQFNPNITLEREQYLVETGWDEFVGLGQRFQQAFPTLLPSTYSPNHYFFRSTNTQRTNASLQAFADGLFGVNGYEQVLFESIPKEDLLLTPYNNCSLFTYVVKNFFYIEPYAFKEGPEYQHMLTEVSAKLGFHGSQALRASDVELLALICIWEQIWDINSTAPFCTAFSVSNHQVLEYYGDLEWYYYGIPDYRTLFENLNCFLIQDLIEFLQSNDRKKTSNANYKAKIFNTHLDAIKLFFVTFGSFEDDVPLNRHNFAQQAHRLWKNSLMMPMAANLAVIKYDCSGGDNDVLFLLNEKPFQMEGCNSNGVCKQSVIINKFKRFSNVNCLDVYCRNS